MITLQENLSPTNQGQTTLDEDLKRIRDAKYDPVLEASVCSWIGQIIGQNKPASESAASWLKTGDILCQLINAIRPGTLKKYNANTTSKFKQMENITLFLRACREVGMLEKDLFSTIDLYESKDMNAVILSLFNLGGTIQSTIPYFTGPKLGIKQTNRNFAVVPQLQKPPVAVVPAPRPVSPVSNLLVRSRPIVPPELSPKPEKELESRSVVPEATKSVISSPVLQRSVKEAAGAPVVLVPAATAISVANLIRQPESTGNLLPSNRVSPQPTVASLKPTLLPAAPRAETKQITPDSPQPPVVSAVEMDIKPRRRLPLNNNNNSKQVMILPAQLPTQAPPPLMVLHPAAMGSYQSYGSSLLKQVSRKNIILARDGSEESVAHATVEWIESVLNEAKPAVLTPSQWLASGEILCRLANAVLTVSPNPNIRIPAIARSIDSMNQQIENGKKFLSICTALGVAVSDTFNPVDLFQGRDLRKVINCVYTLGGILQNYEWWVHCPTAAQLGRRIRIQNLVKV
jgi:hypothetical protein